MHYDLHISHENSFETNSHKNDSHLVAGGGNELTSDELLINPILFFATPSHRLPDIPCIPSMLTSAFLERLGWEGMHCMCYMDLLLLFWARTYSIIRGVDGELD